MPIHGEKARREWPQLLFGMNAIGGQVHQIVHEIAA
jgi:hypothetical protein